MHMTTYELGDSATMLLVGLLMILIPVLIGIVALINHTGVPDDSTSMELTFKEFLDFYRLNPDRYELRHNLVCAAISPGNSNGYTIIRFSWVDRVRYKHWHRQHISSKARQAESNLKREYLETVQVDIDRLTALADKDIEDGINKQKQIFGNLRDEKVGG